MPINKIQPFHIDQTKNFQFGNLNASNIVVSVLNSNVATGTAPFVVTSTTQVANLNVATAGTVTTNAQPNITSVGTLSNLTSNGTINFTGASNVSLGTIANVKITGGANGQIITTDGLGNLTFSAASSGSDPVTKTIAIFGV